MKVLSQGEYAIDLAGKTNRSMDRIVAHPLLHSSIALNFCFAALELKSLVDTEDLDIGSV